MNEYLKEVRSELDEVDEKLISLFLKRLELSERVAELKFQNGGNVYDPAREKAKIEKSTGNLMGEDKLMAEDFMHYLMDKSKTRQNQVIERLKNL